MDTWNWYNAVCRLYLFLKRRQDIEKEKSRLGGCLGLEGLGRKWRLTTKDMGIFWGSHENVLNWLCHSEYTTEMHILKAVNCMVCELCLLKAVTKKYTLTHIIVDKTFIHTHLKHEHFWSWKTGLVPTNQLQYDSRTLSLKMAEQKDVSSPLLPETQITTNCWITMDKKNSLPRKIPCVQRQISHRKTVGGAQSW